MLKSKLIPYKFINNTNVIVLKYAKIEIINFKNKRKISHLSIALPLHLCSYLYFLHLDSWSFSINSVILVWNFSWLILGSSVLVSKPPEVFFFLFFPSFSSSFRKLRGGVCYLFNLNYIFFSLFHCMIDW